MHHSNFQLLKWCCLKKWSDYCVLFFRTREVLSLIVSHSSVWSFELPYVSFTEISQTLYQCEILFVMYSYKGGENFYISSFILFNFFLSFHRRVEKDTFSFHLFTRFRWYDYGECTFLRGILLDFRIVQNISGNIITLGKFTPASPGNLYNSSQNWASWIVYPCVVLEGVR